jgi:hypothetical protein
LLCPRHLPVASFANRIACRCKHTLHERRPRPSELQVLLNQLAEDVQYASIRISMRRFSLSETQQ